MILSRIILGLLGLEIISLARKLVPVIMDRKSSNEPCRYCHYRTSQYFGEGVLEQQTNEETIP